MPQPNHLHGSGHSSVGYGALYENENQATKSWAERNEERIHQPKKGAPHSKHFESSKYILYISAFFFFFLLLFMQYIIQSCNTNVDIDDPVDIEHQLTSQDRNPVMTHEAEEQLSKQDPTRPVCIRVIPIPIPIPIPTYYRRRRGGGKDKKRREKFQLTNSLSSSFCFALPLFFFFFT